MQNQRRIVVLLRWVMFIALAYLLWAAGGLDSWPGVALLLVVAVTNLALARLNPGRWEHPALLPVVAVLDIGVLTASMFLGHGFARDFFFAYWVLLAAVALLPTLRWATLATLLAVSGYGTYLALTVGWDILQAPELLGRLGFLFSVGITYGGLTEAGKVWLREAALQSQLVGWVGKLRSAFSDEFDSFEVIRQILLDLQEIYPVTVRASVVQIAGGQIHVISSSDDASVRELDLDPTRYPELTEVVASGEPMVIDDLQERHAELEGKGAPLRFNSLLLCPVNLRDPSMGHVVLRVARESAPFTPGVIRTTQHVAEAIAVIFRQAKVRELMERSERMEVVSQITTSVSHSFNGLLSTVLLSAESLRREAVRGGVCDAECARKFQSIDLAVKEGMTIVERLAAWTRLQRDPNASMSRNGTLEPVRLLEDAWRYAQPHWLRREATRDLKLELDVDETRRVQGHAPELREILLNMIINAIDAMPKGGVLSLSIHEDDEGQVVFGVKDTGVGMTDEEMERVFEPLYTTKGSGGTGLGMTIARSLAHRHHGRIRAESRPGVGSHFRLVLPGTDAEPASVDGDDEAGAANAGPPGPGRVLLVDGNDLVRDVMVRLLQTLDYEIDTVGSPDEALVMVKAGRDYRGILADAGAVAGAVETFLAELEAAVPNLPRRALFYSTRVQTDEFQSLEAQYGFGFVDRSAGLAALTEALRNQVGDSTGREAA